MFHIHLVNSPSVLKSIKQFFSSSSVPKRLQRFQLSVTRSKQQNRISFSIYSLPSGCLNKGVTPEIFFLFPPILEEESFRLQEKTEYSCLKAPYKAASFEDQFCRFTKSEGFVFHCFTTQLRQHHVRTILQLPNQEEKKNLYLHSYLEIQHSLFITEVL